jgi:Tfp pilus assembly protein PilZ
MRWDFLRFTKPKVREHKQRAAKRYRTVGVRCELGTVLDISESGLRMQVDGKCPVKVGDILALTLRDCAHQTTVRGCVVWVKQGSNTHSTCGVAFVDVRPGTRQVIEQIAGVGEALAKDKSSNPADASKSPAAGQTAGGQPSASKADARQGGTGQATSGQGADSRTANENEPTKRSVRASIEIEDLYELFSLSPTATTDEIHQAFRSMARNLHPDRNPLPDAAERFSQISKAYRVLRDPELRARYDEMRNRAA